MKFFLEEMSWPEVKEVLKETDLALLPVGCTEEHGLHLPLNVDTACVRYISEKVADQLYDHHQRQS
jgi:creatinine amidohydrolase